MTSIINNVLASLYNSNNTWFTVKYIIVTIVFLLLLWVLSRYLIKRTQFGEKRCRTIKLIDIVYISRDSFICIAEHKNSRYIIASNRNSIALLDKINIDDSEKNDDIIEMDIKNHRSFSDFMSKVVGGGNKNEK